MYNRLLSSKAAAGTQKIALDSETRLVNHLQVPRPY
jgi:hypothetical protein